MRYGIYDTKDNCWLGDSHGPKLFEDFAIARVASQVLETQVFGTDLGARYEAKEFIDGNLRKRDEVKLKMNALKALGRIEGGRA